MNASQHGADRRIRPSTLLLLCGALLVLLLGLAAPAGAYVQGKLVWSKTSGTAKHERGFDAIAKAPKGAFYGVGQVTTGGAKGGDFLVVKYNAAGRVLWTRTWDSGGGADLYDYAYEAVSDAKGNLWIAGLGVGDSGNDIVTIKYSPSGTPKWVQRWNGGIDGWHDLRGLALDGQGNCAVTGTVYRGATTLDIVTIEYTSGGDEKWVARYNQDDGDATDGPKWSSDVAFDAAGDVYVCGATRHDSAARALVLKFAGADGALLKQAAYDAGADSWLQAIAVRGQAVVVTGYAAPVSGQEDLLVVKYDQSLTEQYRFSYADPRGALARDWGNDVAIGAHGNAFVGGLTNYAPPGGSGYYDSALVLKVNAAGSAADWVRTYKPSGRGAEVGRLILDTADNAYVGGYLDSQRGQEDMLLLKYSAAGARKWVRSWHDTGTDDDSLGGIVLSGARTLYVAGEGNAKGDYDRAVVQRYDR